MSAANKVMHLDVWLVIFCPCLYLLEVVIGITHLGLLFSHDCNLHLPILFFHRNKLDFTSFYTCIKITDVDSLLGLIYRPAKQAQGRRYGTRTKQLSEPEKNMNTKILAQFALIAASLAYASATFAQKEIRGSGATFPSIIYSTWAFGYSKDKGVAVKYASTGSGEGIRSMSAREVDFGATDVPLSEQELQKAGLIQFPTVAGGIVPVVNLPGASGKSLKLTGAVLADIFSGKIKVWNDARIAALNDGLQLPALKITRVVREDSSGTTEAFTTYLAASSPEWVGSVGRKVTWGGNAVAVKGTDAIAETVKSTSGAIGYVSFDRVAKFGLNPIALRNKTGKFVSVSENSIAAAVRGSGLRTDLRASLIDVNSPDAWPLVDATYILVDASPKAAVDASRTLKFFYWAFLKGDDIVRGTGFAPLPAEVQARVVRLLGDVKSQDRLPIDYISGAQQQIVLAMR